MKYRTLGKTKYRVSEIGLGTSYLHLVDESEVRALLNLSSSAGITLYDTGNSYGHGLAEKYLGNFLTTSQSNVVITKIDVGFARKDIHKELLMNEFDKAIKDSQQRLKMDTLDILLLHKPPCSNQDFMWISKFMERAKNNGIIAFWGISITTYDELYPFIENIGDLDVVETPYNMLFQDPRLTIFDTLRKENIGVIANSVLQGGILSGKSYQQLSSLAKSTHNLSFEMYSEVLDTLKDRNDYATNSGSLLRCAIKFTLDNLYVHSALIGTSSAEHLKECINGYQEI